MPEGLEARLPAEALRLETIIPDLRDTGHIAHPHGALEMVVQAAVVQIDGAHHGFSVVADEDLAVYEAGAVLVELHTGAKQRGVMRLGQRIGHFLVRDAGQDQTHIHAALGGKFQRCLHLAVEDQVGRHDVDIALRAVEDVHVDQLAHAIVVHGAVGVGHDEAVFLRGLRRRVQKALPGERFLAQMPHLQEHQREAARGRAAQADRAVLPVAEALALVDVFVGQIHAAGEGDLPVDDQDLAVVAIVVMGGDEGVDRREGAAFDAEHAQPLGIVPRQREEFAAAIVHHAHGHTLRGLAGEDLQHAAPHETLVDDEILQKDEFFGLLELLQQHGEHVVAQREVTRVGPVIHREAARAVDVVGQPHSVGLLPPEALNGFRILGNAVARGVAQPHIAVAQQAVPDIAERIQIEQSADDGQEHDDHDPCDLGAVVMPAVEQIEGHDGGKDRADGHIMGQIDAQAAEDDDKQQDLEEHEDQEQPGPAENGTQQSVAPFFQQTEPGAVVRQTAHIRLLFDEKAALR